MNAGAMMSGQTAGPKGSPAAGSWLMPREHGAYALVLAPLLTAFCRGEASLVGLGFAVAAVALFLAHEPALVLLAQRGGRVRRELGGRAWLALLARGGLALVAGGYALAHADVVTRWSVLGPAVLGLGLVALSVRGLEKSGVGTLLLALSAAAGGVPVMLANGWVVRDAVLTAGVFAAVGTASMLTVRELIPKRQREAGLAVYVGWLTVIVALVLVGAAALRGDVPAYFAWAFAPTLGVAAVLLRVRPHPRHLRVVGWSLAAAKVATFAVLAFA